MRVCVCVCGGGGGGGGAYAPLKHHTLKHIAPGLRGA